MDNSIEMNNSTILDIFLSFFLFFRFFPLSLRPFLVRSCAIFPLEGALNGLVSPSAPLLRADLFYLFAQPRGKSADYVEIPSPKPSEPTPFQSIYPSLSLSLSLLLASSRAFECLLACSSSVSITRSSAKQIDRLLSPIFARLSTPSRFPEKQREREREREREQRRSLEFDGKRNEDSFEPEGFVQARVTA